MDVKFYMKRDEVDSDYIDLESYFDGMKYSKCEGLEDFGKIKNIYTETYSDSDTLRVHIPTNITREATTITFTFAFIGDNRQDLYHRFVKHITGHKIRYYDTARMQQAYIVLLNEVKTKEDVYKGKGYILVDFTFQNLWGECKNLNNEPDSELELIGSSTTAVIGKSISFSAKFNGVVLDAGDWALFVNGQLVTTGVAGSYYITYPPTSSGEQKAQAMYDSNGEIFWSNYWHFSVPVSGSEPEPES